MNYVDPEGLEVTVVFYSETGTIRAFSTEGEFVEFEGVFSGGGKMKNDMTKGHVPFNGPTPPGTYLLGDPVSAAETHPDNTGDLMWVPILNKETLSDRVFVTDPTTGEKVERNAMFLHPGSVSQGCITFPNRDTKNGDLGNPDFTKLKEMLAKTKRIRRWQGGNGRLGGGKMVSFPGVLVVK